MCARAFVVGAKEKSRYTFLHYFSKPLKARVIGPRLFMFFQLFFTEDRVLFESDLKLYADNGIVNDRWFQIENTIRKHKLRTNNHFHFLIT